MNVRFGFNFPTSAAEALATDFASSSGCGQTNVSTEPGKLRCLNFSLPTNIAVVKPRAIVCLGSTAAQAVIGPKFRVSAQRAQFVPSDLAPFVTATVHPSSILRAPGDEARHEEMRRFVDDLKAIWKAISVPKSYE